MGFAVSKAATDSRIVAGSSQGLCTGQITEDLLSDRAVGDDERDDRGERDEDGGEDHGACRQDVEAGLLGEDLADESDESGGGWGEDAARDESNADGDQEKQAGRDRLLTVRHGDPAGGRNTPQPGRWLLHIARPLGQEKFQVRDFFADERLWVRCC